MIEKDDIHVDVELLPTVTENTGLNDAFEQLLKGSKGFITSPKLISGFCFTKTVRCVVTVQPFLTTVKLTVNVAPPHPNDVKVCVGFCMLESGEPSPKSHE